MVFLPKYWKSIDKRLEECVLRAGSKTQFYLETGLTQRVVNRWENKKVAPRIGEIEILADYLGLSLSDFFKDVDPPPPPRFTARQALNKLVECFDKHHFEDEDC